MNANHLVKRHQNEMQCRQHSPFVFFFSFFLFMLLLKQLFWSSAAVSKENVLCVIRLTIFNPNRYSLVSLCVMQKCMEPQLYFGTCVLLYALTFRNGKNSAQQQENFGAWINIYWMQFVNDFKCHNIIYLKSKRKKTNNI